MKKPRGMISGKLFNNDGATSVLIMFMMIVLVTLGVFAMTSARVNLTFSRKAQTQHDKFYQLDAIAEAYMQKADDALIAAEREAMSGGGEFSSAYLKSAAEKLQALDMPGVSANLRVNDDDGDDTPITKLRVDAEISLQSDADSKLKLSFAVSVPDYYGLAQGTVPKRYEILAWYERQTPFDYGGFEVWDGSFN